MAHHKRPALWQKVRSEVGPTLPLLQVRYDWLQNPRTTQEQQRIVLETSDWVNVVALTEDRQVVVVRQYRSGTDKISTEIPGGMIDDGEDHQTAARRELKEETGYTSERWQYLGYVEPNPAFMANVCHQWLAEDVVRTAELTLDDGEDITVDTLTWAEVQAEIRAGTFRHSLALLALAHVFDLRG